MSQEFLFSSSGSQDDANNLPKKVVMLPKEVRDLSKKQVVFKRVTLDDHYVKVGAMVDISKYYPLDSYSKYENFIIVNFSDSLINVPQHMRSLLGIKEVLVANSWIPAEYFHFDDCRTGDHPFKLQSGQMVLISNKKLQGDKAGTIRFRLLTCSALSGNLLSEHFQGTYSENQLLLPLHVKNEFTKSRTYNIVYLTSPEMVNWECD